MNSLLDIRIAPPIQKQQNLSCDLNLTNLCNLLDEVARIHRAIVVPALTLAI
jgi:hypothetical protein